MISKKDFDTLNEYHRELLEDPRIKVYVSGPVSMYNDNDLALSIFDKVAKNVQEKFDTECGEDKYLVVNPVRFNLTQFEGVNDMTWGDFIVGDLLLLSTCNYICMMPDWRKSSGAVMEHDFATRNGIEVIYEKDNT